MTDMHDAELVERYQRAVVSARGLHAQAQAARDAGKIDYMAEIEAYFNDGGIAVYGWLLGRSPVSPQRMFAAVVSNDTMREEFLAAEAEKAAGEQRRLQRQGDPEHAYDLDHEADYADGVSSALWWALSRSTAFRSA